MIEKDELDKMSLPEKVAQHARDVLATENSSGFPRMDYQVFGGSKDGEHQAEYPAQEGKYIYDFLFGGGSLGYPLRPTIVGEGVIKVAELMDATVSFLDFTFARFNKRITQKAIERAFFPIWEMSEKLHFLPQPVDRSEILRHTEQARLKLSQIYPEPK